MVDTETNDEKPSPALMAIASPPETISKNVKDKDDDQRLENSRPLRDALHRPTSPFSDDATYSADNSIERPSGRLFPPRTTNRLSSSSPAPRPSTWNSSILKVWYKNKGLFLVMISQLFGVMMSVTTRLLEMDGAHGAGMDPFQILFARMMGTLVLSGTYQWLASVPYAPFGPSEVWWLLLARGVGGFFGVFGMYYSLEYLPLSDATVITFLAPVVACFACSVLLREPFTRREQLAGLVSFLGVILIARPASLMSSSSDPGSAGNGGSEALPTTNGTMTADMQGLKDVTPSERLGAVGVALSGVLGAACAYTTLRWIGKRAHPLISVNYFAAISAIVSIVVLSAFPEIGFRMPASTRQWLYLLFLGICGFVMQLLLTAGLAYEKSSRATSMVYTQLLWALAFDKLVWKTTPGITSIIGSSLILGSALYVAMQNNKTKESEKIPEGSADEEQGLMMMVDNDHGDDVDDGRGPLRGIQEVQLRTLRV